MRRCRGLGGWLVLFLGACGGTSDVRPPLSTEIRALIEQSGAEVAVAFQTLDGRDGLLIEPEESFHAASTMKIPVMIELFRQERAGLLQLDELLPITNQFSSIIDGSPYTLSPEDDSDAEIYQAAGQSRTLRELCERMITISSNLATNLLIVRLGVDNIQNTVDQLGAGGMQVRRCLEDGKAYREGVSNTTTAEALLQLLERIGHLRAVDEPASREMIEILKRQQFDEAIPAGLPAGVAVAHKTGQITSIHHDAGIVFARRPYVLVILVRGLEDDQQSARLMSDISRTIYQFVEEVE